MKILIQRVTQAKVEVEENRVGAIGMGALVFVGITHNDTPKEAIWLANKFAHLRMFEDEEGKMNRSIVEANGEALVISQFTLYADCAIGRRPSFSLAAMPEAANILYERFVEEVRNAGLRVQTGIFGAEMKVFLVNDGPVTLILER